MTDVNDVDHALLEEAEKFASSLSDTVRAVVGDSADPFTALVHSEPGAETTALAIRQRPVQGIILAVDKSPMLKVKVSLRCIWDHRRDFLAVERSSFAVLAIVAMQDECSHFMLISPTAGLSRRRQRVTLPACR